MPIRIEITGENADHAWSELKGLAAPAFQTYACVPVTSDHEYETAVSLGSVGVSRETDGAEPVTDAPAEDARDASVTLADVEPAPKAKRGRKPKEPESAAETLKLTDPAPLISTDPENRVNPADPADPEVADDPTEPPAEPADDKAYTREDVRDALIGYQNVYGPAAAQSDCPAIMGYAKMSAIPESADAFREVVQKLKKATQENPYNRAKV